MAYVVTEACIRCKYTACVAVCPTDCFREGQTMLVIDPRDCIHCGLCLPACPVGAIASEEDARGIVWRTLNRDFATRWPPITRTKPALPDASDWQNRAEKYRQWFDPRRGAGD